jgi:hypothetical protein
MKLSSPFQFVAYFHGVDKATGYGLDSPGSIPSSARFFSFPQHPD